LSGRARLWTRAPTARAPRRSPDTTLFRSAARMLPESSRKEVGRDMAFRDYIKNAAELGVVSDSLLELANQDVMAIEYAIRHERRSEEDAAELQSRAKRVRRRLLEPTDTTT